MASEIKSDKLSPSTSTALQLGDASDTVTIPTGATFTVTDGLGVASGGTGVASFAVGDILYASGSTTLTKLGKGTGLQGLQTNSGATAPEWANSPQSLLTAAGDFLYASGANTLAKLAKGSDDHVLTLASGVPSWAAAAGAGLLQLKQTVVTAGTATTTSTSYSDITGMTVDITPTLSTSKILVFCNYHGGGTMNYSASFSLVRDSTQIYMGDAASARTRSYYGGISSENRMQYDAVAVYVDAPATTSATTYKMQWLVESGSDLWLNRDSNDNDASYSNRTASSITAMEIAVGAL